MCACEYVNACVCGDRHVGVGVYTCVCMCIFGCVQVFQSTGYNLYNFHIPRLCVHLMNIDFPFKQ